MGQLIEKLEASVKAKGVRIRYGTRALPTQQDAAKRPIVVATSFPQARELVEGVDAERARAMGAIAMIPIVSITSFYKGPPPRQGFGVLFPPIEKRRALGVLFNNCIFEGRVPANKLNETSSETWIMGGALAPKELISASDEEILGWIDEERARAFGARGERLEAVITRWPQALPHYTRELEKRLPHFCENRENLFLIGNYLGQIGLGKILERAARLPAEIAAKGRWS
jgi:protoporphyrinogen oxidase